MIIELLHNQFCKVDSLKNYLNNAVRAENNGVLGTYQFSGTDLIPIIPSDAECSFSYWRQDGDYNTIKKDSGECSLDYTLQGKFVFIYFAREKKNQETVYKIVKKALSEITLDNFYCEIKKVNTTKADVLKQEFKSKTLDNFVLFSDCTYMSITVDILYTPTENCDDICL